MDLPRSSVIRVLADIMFYRLSLPRDMERYIAILKARHGPIFALSVPNLGSFIFVEPSDMIDIIRFNRDTPDVSTQYIWPLVMYEHRQLITSMPGTLEWKRRHERFAETISKQRVVANIHLIDRVLADVSLLAIKSLPFTEFCTTLIAEITGSLFLGGRYNLFTPEGNPDVEQLLREEMQAFDALGRLLWAAPDPTNPDFILFRKHQAATFDAAKKVFDRYRTACGLFAPIYDKPEFLNDILGNISSPNNTIGRYLQGAIYCLVRYPHVQRKIIDDPGYFSLFLREFARMYPIGSAIIRSPQDDMIIKGFKIPKGERVYLLRDRNRVDHAEKFLPERFSRDDRYVENYSDVLRDIHNKAVTCEEVQEYYKSPLTRNFFGFGPRSCPGQSVVTTIIEQVVKFLLNNFTLEPIHLTDETTYGLIVAVGHSSTIVFRPPTTVS